MPTIILQNGFRIAIYLNDHAPQHVHAFKSGETVINLGDEQTKPYIRENRGMSKQDERLALKLVAENQENLLKRWRELNG